MNDTSDDIRLNGDSELMFDSREPSNVLMREPTEVLLESMVSNNQVARMTEEEDYQDNEFPNLEKVNEYYDVNLVEDDDGESQD